MGAPAKATGGKKIRTAKAPSARKGARGAGRLRARAKSQAEVESVPRDTQHSAAPFRESRAEAIRAKTPKRPKARSKPKPPRHDTAHSARPRILEAARKMASERGYMRLRLLDITTEAQITHQGFYGHFANKRHAVAVATSDELGSIADLAMRGSQRDEGWAERLLSDIDKALVEAYPSSDGPERWLRDRFLVAFASEGGYSALRINELIKISKLGHGEFYRRYGGKLGCLRRIYSEVLVELEGEVAASEMPMAGIGGVFASRPERTRFLILGASHLPEGDQEDPEAATQDSLPALLKEIVSSSAPATSEEVRSAIAGGLLEVIRSAVLAGRVEQVESELRMLARAWGRQGSGDELPLAA